MKSISYGHLVFGAVFSAVVIAGGVFVWIDSGSLRLELQGKSALMKVACELTRGARTIVVATAVSGQSTGEPRYESLMSTERVVKGEWPAQFVLDQLGYAGLESAGPTSSLDGLRRVGSPCCVAFNQRVLLLIDKRMEGSAQYDPRPWWGATIWPFVGEDLVASLSGLPSGLGPPQALSDFTRCLE